MEINKKTTLHYQEGTSDKIYEVEICQTNEATYLVNFRYGRRGSKLKEDSKTKQPVSLTEAEKIFNKLVQEKLKKGYLDITPKNPTTSNRQQTILNRLASKENNKNWPLTRIIWRAGELKIKEATPLLIDLIGTGEALRDYCIAWALGWCGDESAIFHLKNLYNNSTTPEFVQRIAWEAWLKLADETTKIPLRNEKIQELPQPLRELAENSSAAFAPALRNYLDVGNYQHFSVLDTIYQIDNPHLRPILLEILRTAPLKPNYFKPIRHIFKMAEYRHDAEVFALLTYRFEKEREMYRNRNNWGASIPGVGYLPKVKYEYNRTTRKHNVVGYPLQEEKEKPDSQIAYNNYTRNYLRRRVWRTLQQLGEEGNSDYINMAVAILLNYTDTDGVPPKTSTFYRYTQNWNRLSTQVQWDSYASYLTFNHILYENSTRYFLKPNSSAWRCREGYKPGDPIPEVREEAFPQLWEKHPEALLRLLLESNCNPVHDFAAKALKICEDFCAKIEPNILLQLLNKPYPATAQFAFELARKNYNPNQPNLELVQALANCAFTEARTQAYQWIELGSDTFLQSIDFVFSLIISPYSDTRAFIRNLINSATFTEAETKIIIGRIIAHLLSLESSQGEVAQDIGETLLSQTFISQLSKIGLEIVMDILQHPLPENQAVGANILLIHQTPVANFPPELIESLINSPHQSVQVLGVRIFGELPDAKLLASYNLLITMLTHEQAEIRQAIAPKIANLASQYSEFATKITTDLINLLLKKETKPGLHNNLVTIIKQYLSGVIDKIPKDTALQLLKSKYAPAQDLGGLVLNANYVQWGEEFETSEIVKLANNEILSVRQAAWAMLTQILERLRNNLQEKLAAVRILEAKWDDSKEFGLNFFQNNFTEEDWTPEVMILICDSIKNDVRQFGRELVTQYFQANKGEEYLLKFSEHPNADMQLFATNYLQTYAADNPEKLRQLQPYFITVLSGVNRGRIAKEKVFAFLEKEAEKSEQAAEIVAEILTRQSLTIAIGDKAKSIQTMLKIKQQYPHISLPIQVKNVVEVRS